MSVLAKVGNTAKKGTGFALEGVGTAVNITAKVTEGVGKVVTKGMDTIGDSLLNLGKKGPLWKKALLLPLRAAGALIKMASSLLKLGVFIASMGLKAIGGGFKLFGGLLRGKKPAGFKKGAGLKANIKNYAKQKGAEVVMKHGHKFAQKPQQPQMQDVPRRQQYRSTEQFARQQQQTNAFNNAQQYSSMGAFNGPTVMMPVYPPKTNAFEKIFSDNKPYAMVEVPAHQAAKIGKIVARPDSNWNTQITYDAYPKKKGFDAMFNNDVPMATGNVQAANIGSYNGRAAFRSNFDDSAFQLQRSQSVPNLQAQSRPPLQRSQSAPQLQRSRSFAPMTPRELQGMKVTQNNLTERGRAWQASEPQRQALKRQDAQQRVGASSGRKMR